MLFRSPHLWMFLLQSLTPAGNEVLLIDGNTHPMTDPELVQYALDQKIGLVGIGAMTRMIAKAYRVADALRAASVPVVEVNCAWTNSYSPAATKRALDSIGDEPVPYKISHFVARIFFRGIYFPPQGRVAVVEADRAESHFGLPPAARVLHQLERH